MRERLGKNALARRLHRFWLYRLKRFPGSERYWDERYARGGTSGAGSTSRLAAFKANVVNEFVAEHGVETVIEYGSGDGGQLRLARYPSYLGFDVSPTAVELCRESFADDPTKRFELMGDYAGETAQLTLSLDVLYHLIEDEVFEAYMRRLFDSSERFVIVYSSDYDGPHQHHERRRRFTDWVAANEPGWNLSRHVPNPYPLPEGDEPGSDCDFYVYERDGG